MCLFPFNIPMTTDTFSNDIVIIFSMQAFGPYAVPIYNPTSKAHAFMFFNELNKSESIQKKLLLLVLASISNKYIEI